MKLQHSTQQPTNKTTKRMQTSVNLSVHTNKALESTIRLLSPLHEKQDEDLNDMAAKSCSKDRRKESKVFQSLNAPLRQMF